jgi:hypothetical protein
VAHSMAKEHVSRDLAVVSAAVLRSSVVVNYANTSQGAEELRWLELSYITCHMMAHPLRGTCYIFQSLYWSKGESNVMVFVRI